jgi:hypothetical protein
MGAITLHCLFSSHLHCLNWMLLLLLLVPLLEMGTAAPPWLAREMVPLQPLLQPLQDTQHICK